MMVCFDAPEQLIITKIKDILCVVIISHIYKQHLQTFGMQKVQTIDKTTNAGLLLYITHLLTDKMIKYPFCIYAHLLHRYAM